MQIGGNEFIVILGGNEAEQTFTIADSIRAAVNQLPVMRGYQHGQQLWALP